MKKYAVLEKNQVTNIIVATSKENAEAATSSVCIEVAEDVLIEIGYFYSNGQFLQDEPEA
ncbi:MAG: hypothetical protein EBT15_12465 [Betaproteobacteria bacterium]|jgi:hypothetical protein|nr:hypothetical protein [Betaproteobacteria bacterium]